VNANDFVRFCKSKYRRIEGLLVRFIHYLFRRVWFLVNEALDVGFQVCRDGNLARLAHQELPLEVPNGIPRTGFVLEELPDLGRGIALDLGQLHEDAREVFRLGKVRDFGIEFELLPPVFAARESENHELFPVYLVEFPELGVLGVCQTSFRRDVRGVDDLSAEVFHRLDGAVALGGG